MFAGNQNRFDNSSLRFKLRAALDGVLAQLVEHHNGIVGVKGSNPLGSTIQKKGKPSFDLKRGVILIYQTDSSC
jgi:hypothetical protein